MVRIGTPGMKSQPKPDRPRASTGGSRKHRPRPTIATGHSRQGPHRHPSSPTVASAAAGAIERIPLNIKATPANVENRFFISFLLRLVSMITLLISQRLTHADLRCPQCGPEARKSRKHDHDQQPEQHAARCVFKVKR